MRKANFESVLLQPTENEFNTFELNVIYWNNIYAETRQIIKF